MVQDKIMKWFTDDTNSVIPENMVKSGFSMKLNGVKHNIIFTIDGSRLWNGQTIGKDDCLMIEQNKWVDFQMESMFKGW